MKFYQIHPEVPGGIGKNTEYDKSTLPWKLLNLHVQFDGWLGGDIMKVSNCYLVTEKLKVELETTKLTGIAFFKDIEVDYSLTFQNLHPDLVLPKIYWLIIDGIMAKDDFGMIDYFRLSVSENALSVIKKYKISDMEISEL
jgi:hypothetical protein